MNEHLKNRANLANIHCLTADLEALPLNNAQFDLAISFWSSHHCRRPGIFFKEIFRVLKPGAFLLVIDGVDEAGSPGQELHRRVHQLSIAIDRARGRRHTTLLSRRRSQSLLNQAGFQRVQSEKISATEGILSRREVQLLHREALRIVKNVYPQEIRLLRDGAKRFADPLRQLTEALTSAPLELHPFQSIIVKKPATAMTSSKPKPSAAPNNASQEKTVQHRVVSGYPLRFRDLPDEMKPRQRMIRYGPDVLKNHELLAILLVTGTTKENVLEMAKRLMQEYGSRAIAQERSVRRLMDTLKIGPKKACQIAAAFELGRRFFEEPRGKAPMILGAEDAYEYLLDMAKLTREHFRGLYLNTRGRLIRDEIISIGTLNMSVVHPREVFLPAVEFSAAAVILAHNHPSGDPTPSHEDLDITRQMVEAGKVMGIEIFDHIIIGEESYVSLHREGKLGS